MVQVKIVADDPKFVPSYESDGAAGADVRYAGTGRVIIERGQIKALRVGFSVEIPKGYEMQIRPRSGLASQGLTVMNAPGTIDSDYRGEVQVLMVNHSRIDMVIMPGDRIAQVVVVPCAPADFELVSELSETERGTGGFGSTGKE